MEFLQKIKINKKLVRKNPTDQKERMFRWVEEEIEETEVFFLGYRTLQNGTVETESYGSGWEYYTYFTPSKYIKAMLVIKDKKTNPFYIPIYTPIIELKIK